MGLVTLVTKNIEEKLVLPVYPELYNMSDKNKKQNHNRDRKKTMLKKSLPGFAVIYGRSSFSFSLLLLLVWPRAQLLHTQIEQQAAVETVNRVK